MSIAAAGDNRDDASDPELGTLLDRPLHAGELEDGEGQRNLRSGLWRDLRSELRALQRPVLRVERELNPIVRNRSDGSAPNFVPGCDVELLPDFGAQHAGEMSSMVAHQSSGVSGKLVGDPAAACHESVVSCQFSVLSKRTRQTPLLRTENRELRT